MLTVYAVCAACGDSDKKKAEQAAANAQTYGQADMQQGVQMGQDAIQQGMDMTDF